ncbi:hypothetical protein J5N97_024922 [Dioscorea zingiberensis]|uniref:BAH domain-containing protein n=1 Tax=Dioscorea zingiberensis TaxID=325984 RepID=A0A9D5C8D2_9LILI|nr:hypothetical protein J5N97_024922 [Dioscorea zingiberensis]
MASSIPSRSSTKNTKPPKPCSNSKRNDGDLGNVGPKNAFQDPEFWGLRRSSRIARSPGFFLNATEGIGCCKSSSRRSSSRDSGAPSSKSEVLDNGQLSASEHKSYHLGSIASNEVLKISLHAEKALPSCCSLEDLVDGESEKRNKKSIALSRKEEPMVNGTTFFVGSPVPEDEARERWPHHYVKAKKSKKGTNPTNVYDEDEVILDVKCHYLQANITGCLFDIGDCAYVKGEKRKPNFIGRILEFFETTRGEYYFTVQWFYRAEDTVMKEQTKFHDKMRLFYSDIRNDNLLDCIISKVKISPITPSVCISQVIN